MHFRVKSRKVSAPVEKCRYVRVFAPVTVHHCASADYERYVHAVDEVCKAFFIGIVRVEVDAVREKPVEGTFAPEDQIHVFTFFSHFVYLAFSKPGRNRNRLLVSGFPRICILLDDYGVHLLDLIPWNDILDDSVNSAHKEHDRHEFCR